MGQSAWEKMDITHWECIGFVQTTNVIYMQMIGIPNTTIVEEHNSSETIRERKKEIHIFLPTTSTGTPGYLIDSSGWLIDRFRGVDWHLWMLFTHIYLQCSAYSLKSNGASSKLSCCWCLLTIMKNGFQTKYNWRTIYQHSHT